MNVYGALTFKSTIRDSIFSGGDVSAPAAGNAIGGIKELKVQPLPSYEYCMG